MDRASRILVLEDDPDWSKHLQSLLGAKYEVIVTPLLSTAKDLLSTEDFQLAVVDLSLVWLNGGDESGFQFLSYMRSSDLWLDLPVIVLTAYENRDRLVAAFKEYHVFDFVDKAKFDGDNFALLVTKAIAISRRIPDWGETARALVVEDDADWQRRISQILEEEGCLVDIASSYEDAIDRLTSQVYQIATVDIRLDPLDASDASGEVLVDIVRRLRQSVDFIFITAYGEAERIRKAAFDLGARDLLDKLSFEPQHLRLRVRRILRHLIYITIVTEQEGDPPVFRLGQTHKLTVLAGPKRPPRGVSRSLTRPVTSGQFELEVVVHPYDVDVLPGSTQPLIVTAGDMSIPAVFEVIPAAKGRIELVVDLLYRSNMLARIILAGAVKD